MEVVVVGTSPEGEEVAKGPREVVSRVRVNGLEETEGDPNVDCQDVEVIAEEAVEERARNGALGKDEDLERVGVLGSLEGQH